MTRPLLLLGSIAAACIALPVVGNAHPPARCARCQPGALHVDAPGADLDGVLSRAEGLDVDADDALVLATDGGASVLWVANRHDVIDGETRGSLSKLDADGLRELARYLTFTCSDLTLGYDSCTDAAGHVVPVRNPHPHGVAVTPAGDVWVGNAGGTAEATGASVTRVAGELSRCVERNGIAGIQTSHDADQDGWIDVNDPVEFPGLDDECVLFTVVLGESGGMVRALASDPRGDAWVGSYRQPPNWLARVAADGSAVDVVVDDLEHALFGLVVDEQQILWGSDVYAGDVLYLDTLDPARRGTVRNPFEHAQHYGVDVDPDGAVWFGGWSTGAVFRLEPSRGADGFPGGQPAWARLRFSESLGYTRGVVADSRGYLWVALAGQGGNVVRIDRAILPLGAADGHDQVLDSAVDPRVVVIPTEADPVINVAIDRAGFVWATAYNDDAALRLFTSPEGQPRALIHAVPLGRNPVAYGRWASPLASSSSIRTRGSYRRVVPACDGCDRLAYAEIDWSADTPPGSAVRLSVSAAPDLDAATGWTALGTFDHGPVVVRPAAGSTSLALEFELTSDGTTSPRLESLHVVWICGEH